jgi:hypothetical protein
MFLSPAGLGLIEGSWDEIAASQDAGLHPCNQYADLPAYDYIFGMWHFYANTRAAEFDIVGELVLARRSNLVGVIGRPNCVSHTSAPAR